TTARYHYDALGRRIRKGVKIGIDGLARYEQTDFVWHGLRLLQERDTKSGETQTYCYESHDSYTPLASIVTRGARHNYFWYHTDINGAPLEVTDEDGKIAWAGKYHIFGELDGPPLAYFTDPALSSTSYNFRQNLRYAGQYFDKETGLHFNTYRYYAPEIGRFITPDPLGLAGGLNLYQYAPNPMTWIDPLGLMMLYRGMNLSEYNQLVETGKWAAGQGTMEGKWFAESYKNAVTWGNKMGHGGSTFQVVQINVPDDIAGKMHVDLHLDGIGPARYAQVEQLNDPRVKVTWSKNVKTTRC
ncbi:RHS repeat-associated core domain-containing protein, partial [Photorhabdus luminescens]